MGTSLKSLVESGDVDAFNRQLREHEENDEELPSLQAETFEELELAGFDFSDLDLSYAEFAETTCTDVRFDRADLAGAYAHGSTFIDCYFEGTGGDGLALDSCTLAKCTFDGVEFEDVEWTDCQFTECVFEDVVVRNSTVERTTFTEGAWDGVEFVDTSFKLVTLRSVPLADVEMTDCIAKNCYLSGGTTAGEDLLPDGFVEKTGRRRRME